MGDSDSHLSNGVKLDVMLHDFNSLNSGGYCFSTQVSKASPI